MVELLTQQVGLLAQFVAVAKVMNPITLAFAVVWGFLTVYRERTRTQVLFATVTIAALAFSSLHALGFQQNPCAKMRSVRLFEVCSVGSECGQAGDFFSVRNSGEVTENLACYAVSDHTEENVHGAAAHLGGLGELGPGEVKRIYTRELGFRLDKDGDLLVLLRVAYTNGRFERDEAERIDVNPNQAYGCRASGAWAWMNAQTGAAERAILERLRAAPCS